MWVRPSKACRYWVYVCIVCVKVLTSMAMVENRTTNSRLSPPSTQEAPKGEEAGVRFQEPLPPDFHITIPSRRRLEKVSPPTSTADGRGTTNASGARWTARHPTIFGRLNIVTEACAGIRRSLERRDVLQPHGTYLLGCVQSRSQVTSARLPSSPRLHHASLGARRGNQWPLGQEMIPQRKSPGGKTGLAGWPARPKRLRASWLARAADLRRDSSCG